MKVRKSRLSLEVEKQLANEEWDRFLANLNSGLFDRNIAVIAMMRINTIDYRIIKENKRELLG